MSLLNHHRGVFFVVIVYDVTDDKRRNKLAFELKNFGRRVQYSVFEAMLKREEIENMTKRIRKIIDKNQDSVRIYVLTKKSKKEIIRLGVQKDYKEEDILLF